MDDLPSDDYKKRDHGKVILPFTVPRRLDWVLEPTKATLLTEKKLRENQGLDPEPSLRKVSGHNFVNTSILNNPKTLVSGQDNIGENIRAYIHGFSIEVRDIFESITFHLQVESREKERLLHIVSELFAQMDLHPGTVSNAEKEPVFNELIRRTVELSNGHLK